MDQRALDDLTLRNRKNQQNFRARRQQYVRELEQRLKSYESHRVEVTKQVQLAAQRVARENWILRGILKDRLMMTDEDIRDILQNGTYTQTGASHFPAPQDDLAEAAAEIPRESPDILHTVLRSQSSSNQQPQALSDMSLSSSRTADVPNSHALNTPGLDSGIDAMSCEVAAEILASIQVNATTEDMRRELGCGKQDTCQVRNKDVFQVLSVYV